MAYQKLAGIPTRTLNVIPSDKNTIPYPGNLKVSGTTTHGTAATSLRDAGKDFDNLGIKIGDIVYNRTTRGASTVTAVNGDTITVGSGIDFSAVSQEYEVYGSEIVPCLLYFNNNAAGGGVTTTRVSSASGDIVDIGRFGLAIPFQVIQVWETGTDQGHDALVYTACW